MSLFKEYLEERTNKEVLETDTGFAVFSFPNPQTIYIEDIYTQKDKRCTYHATILANKIVNIAKERGCTEMWGSVVPTANNSTISLKVLLAYGFKLKSSTDNFILMTKEI